jgi:hypothetical protein
MACGIEEGFDCADLAALVQQQEFGIQIVPPSVRDYAHKGGHHKFKAMYEQIDRVKKDYATPTDCPEDGDPVLLSIRGYTQHIGVFCMIVGEPWILHAADGAGQVVLQRQRDLAIRGLKVEGYYKWI